MTTLYKCEKCGRTFEDWNECYMHERAHLEPETIYSFELPEELRHHVAEYAGNFRQPVYIYLKSAEYDEDGKRSYIVHRYKLAPDDGIGKELAEALNAAEGVSE